MCLCVRVCACVCVRACLYMVHVLPCRERHSLMKVNRRIERRNKELTSQLDDERKRGDQLREHVSDIHG